MDLYTLAENHGIRILWGLTIPGLRGLYDHHTRTIILRDGMSERITRCVLAHELAHALAGDTHHDSNPTLEHARDAQAAAMLISPAEFYRASALYPDQSSMIAIELDVTVDLVHAYAEILHQV